STHYQYYVNENEDALSEDGKIIESECTLTGGSVTLNENFINGGLPKKATTYNFTVDENGDPVFTGGDISITEFEYDYDGNKVFNRTITYKFDDGSISTPAGCDLTDFNYVYSLIKMDQSDMLKQFMLFIMYTDSYYGQYDRDGNAGHIETRNYFVQEGMTGFDEETGDIDTQQFNWESGELRENIRFNYRGMPKEVIVFTYRVIDGQIFFVEKRIINNVYDGLNRLISTTVAKYELSGYPVTLNEGGQNLVVLQELKNGYVQGHAVEYIPQTITQTLYSDFDGKDNARYIEYFEYEINEDEDGISDDSGSGVNIDVSEATWVSGYEETRTEFTYQGAPIDSVVLSYNVVDGEYKVYTKRKVKHNQYDAFDRLLKSDETVYNLTLQEGVDPTIIENYANLDNFNENYEYREESYTNSDEYDLRGNRLVIFTKRFELNDEGEEVWISGTKTINYSIDNFNNRPTHSLSMEYVIVDGELFFTSGSVSKITFDITGNRQEVVDTYSFTIVPLSTISEDEILELEDQFNKAELNDNEGNTYSCFIIGRERRITLFTEYDRLGRVSESRTDFYQISEFQNGFSSDIYLTSEGFLDEFEKDSWIFEASEFKHVFGNVKKEHLERLSPPVLMEPDQMLEEAGLYTSSYLLCFKQVSSTYDFYVVTDDFGNIVTLPDGSDMIQFTSGVDNETYLDPQMIERGGWRDSYWMTGVGQNITNYHIQYVSRQETVAIEFDDRGRKISYSTRHYALFEGLDYDDGTIVEELETGEILYTLNEVAFEFTHLTVTDLFNLNWKG
ncbi:hypothetical protein BVX93_01935, partial [bacterium B13(2017)]